MMPVVKVDDQNVSRPATTEGPDRVQFYLRDTQAAISAHNDVESPGIVQTPACNDDRFG
jgi:hypothetical protein